MYGWKISLGNHYHQPNSKSQKKRIRKSLENRTPYHFSGLGAGSCSSFPPFIFSIKKRKEKKKKKKKRGCFTQWALKKLLTQVLLVKLFLIKLKTFCIFFIQYLFWSLFKKTNATINKNK